MESLLAGNHIPACTVMCRRHALQAVGGFRQPMGLPNVDYPTWLELCRRGRAASSEEILGFWRQHGMQVTRRFTADMHRNSKWASSFIEALPDSELAGLGIERRHARQVLRRKEAEAAFGIGRLALSNGQTADAWRCFLDAARLGSYETRAQAVVGLACVRLGIDLEWAIRTGNRIRQPGGAT